MGLVPRQEVLRDSPKLPVTNAGTHKPVVRCSEVSMPSSRGLAQLEEQKLREQKSLTITYQASHSVSQNSIGIND